MEDLIPENYYLDAVHRAYPEIMLTFNTEEKNIPNVVDRLSQFFQRNDLGDFEKWRPILRIVHDINADSDTVPNDLFETAGEGVCKAK